MKKTHRIMELLAKHGVAPAGAATPYPDELYVAVRLEDFNRACLALHKGLASPVMALFAVDEREDSGAYRLYCIFAAAGSGQWCAVTAPVSGDMPSYPALSKNIYSASLFEREMKEMFGIEPLGSPDDRRLRLHDEVWPEGCYPLRRDFTAPVSCGNTGRSYAFRRIEGEGVFEVPVGPVHAGIIGPGHFRFSAAGEPVINLEIRLGFTHRGVEKLFEGKDPANAIGLAECVSGDASFAHSLAFCCAVEKIRGLDVPRAAQCLRAVFLELERMYNHASDIGGIALDVGFSFPSAYASLIKEGILALNGRLTGSRYLKGVNRVGGITAGLDGEGKALLLKALDAFAADMDELKGMLFGSASFMDRVDSTGVLANNAAEDLGVTGLAARASGIDRDLRKDFPGIYAAAGFASVCRKSGDVLARLQVRIEEFEGSIRLIRTLAGMLEEGAVTAPGGAAPAEGHALGYAEGWRGPALYWVKTGASGMIERCKIVDASFRNWQGLAHALPGNIVPDFPLCNKSFDLSYPGNDL